MKKLLLMIFAMLGLSGCVSAQKSAEYNDLNVEEFKQLISNPEVQVLDVRTPEEYAEGHIAGAVDINIYDSDFLSKAEKQLDKSRPVAVYCRSGKRSAEAAGILARNGFKVSSLLGGYLAWEKSRP